MKTGGGIDGGQRSEDGGQRTEDGLEAGVDNYAKLVKDNLERLYGNLPGDLGDRIPGEKNGLAYSFTAFGQACVISPDGIILGGVKPPGVIGILLSLYALNATTDLPILEPFKAFKEFSDSAPYVGAFASHTEQIHDIPHFPIF